MISPARQALPRLPSPRYRTTEVFSLRTTEGFFVRIDAEVARLARATAQERQMPLRELVERALREYISGTTEPERRAAALHAMEQALLGRLDRRLGQHLERVAGLYAREAFDVAQTLDLVKRILAYAVRGDKQVLGRYIAESRAEATRTLKQRVNWRGVAEPTIEEQLRKAKDAMTKLEQENQDLKARVEELTRQLADERSRAAAIQERFTWAIKQFESQKGFSRRPLSEFLAQYDRERPTTA